MRTDLTLVVSPLVSLMQDQVEALERIAPGRVALVNAQQDAATNRRAVDGAVAGRVRLLVRRAGAVCVAGVPGAHPPGRDRPVRGRRGALRIAVGARFPAGVLPAGRRGALARRLGDRGVHRDGHARGGAGHRHAAGLEGPGARGDGVRSAEPLLLRRAVHEQGGRGAADRLGAGRAGRAAGDRLRGHARGVRPAVGAAGPRARRRGRRLPRRVAARSPGRRPAALHGGQRAGRGGHECVRHGRRQGRRAHGLPRVGAGVDRGLLPGGRPRGARRRARQVLPVRDGQGQGPARLLHRALHGRGGAAEVGRAQDRELGRGHAAALPAAHERARARRGPGGVRARDRRLHGARRASSSRRRRRPIGCPAASSARGIAPRSRSASRPRRRAPGSAGASTARSGRWSRAPPAAARASCATSATAPSRIRRSPAATSAIRRWFPAAPVKAPRQSNFAQAGDLEEAILQIVGSAQPEVGRTRCVEILRGGRSKVIEKYSYDGLPSYGAYRDLRAEDVLAKVDELLTAGRVRSTGGRYPKLTLA